MTAALGADHKRLRRIWRNMHGRCTDPRADSYPRYGGRGIVVCPEWADFDTFKAWALANGYATELTLERRDGDGSYGPGNCTWATLTEQSQNRSNVPHSPDGVAWCEIARRNGIKPKTYACRIGRGMSPERAATLRPYFAPISDEASDYLTDAQHELHHARELIATTDPNSAWTLAKIIRQIEGFRKARHARPLTVTLSDDGKVNLAVAS